jgi:Xaa-Pro aminopeptidase
MADGLSVGMYRLLERTLGAKYATRFVSAEDVAVSLLGRNIPEEVAYLQESAEISLRLMDEAMRTIRPGVTTERDLFNYIRFRMEQLGVDPGWSEFRSPIVTVGGPRSGRAPGDEKVMPGRLVKINGGVRVKGYSVDLNMNAYVLRPGETAPPPALQHMWDTVVRATAETIKAIKPGVVCRDVDALARRIVREAGYEEWSYEVGHSVGTWIHGIGPTLAPDWPHFGRKPGMKIQVNDVYAIEPAVERLVPELQTTVRVHVQEMVKVTPGGATYMVPPQTALMLITPDGGRGKSAPSSLARSGRPHLER